MVVRVPIVFVLVVELVIEVVVEVVGALAVYVGQRPGAFPEQAVVEALLERSRFSESARSSFSGHVVTCLGVVTTIMPRVPG